MNKYVIVAPKRSGKTTLVNKLFQVSKKNICGYQTQKIESETNKEGLCPLYIFPVGKKPILKEEYCLGYIGKGRHEVNLDVFNNMGVKLITTYNEDDLIIMDEVGFIEKDATLFKDKIFSVLSSNNPVLIMLKDKPNVDFLEKIKNVQGINLIQMNRENRDEVFEIIKEKLC